MPDSYRASALLYYVLPRELCFPERMTFVSKKKKKIMRNIVFLVPLSHSEPLTEPRKQKSASSIKQEINITRT